MADAISKIENCSRCLAPWAAVTIVNAEVDTERMKQLATPRTIYECGSVFHPDNFADFDVPDMEYQSPTCLAAELARHRGS